MRVFLDLRVPQGGVGRYGRDLYEAMRAHSEAPDLILHAPASRLNAPFTPWGRRRAATAARRAEANLFHGLHFELPRTPLPALVTVQDLIPLEFPGSMPNRMRRAAFRRIVATSITVAHRILVPSEQTQRALIEFGAGAEKIRVIPLGVSEKFRPLDDAERARARTQFAGGRRYVACISNPRPHKNFRAFERVAETRSFDAVAVAAGNPVSSPAVTNIGLLSDADLRLFYGGAELFVLPSLMEGFGLPALESVRCGVPVICGSGVGAFPYIAAGVLKTDVSDPNAIAKAIQTLLEDEDLRRGLAKGGLNASEELTIAKTARATLDIYSEVLNQTAER